MFTKFHLHPDLMSIYLRTYPSFWLLVKSFHMYTSVGHNSGYDPVLISFLFLVVLLNAKVYNWSVLVFVKVMNLRYSCKEYLLSHSLMIWGGWFVPVCPDQWMPVHAHVIGDWQRLGGNETETFAIGTSALYH